MTAVPWLPRTPTGLPRRKWWRTLSAETPAPHARDKPKEDKDQLQGTWTVTAHDILGRPASKEFLARGHQWIFAGDKLTLKDRDGVGREGTFQIDSRRNPKVLDATFKRTGLWPGAINPGGRAPAPDRDLMEGIYELEGTP